MQICDKCAYMNDDIGGKKECRALQNVECDGFDSECVFYKTRRQHIEDKDRAIDICREKNLCENCKYSGKPCKKSNEEGGDSNG